MKARDPNWLRFVGFNVAPSSFILSSESDRASRRVGFDMAYGNVPICDPLLGRDAQALAGQIDFRLAARFWEYFDICPCDPAAPAGAEDFEHGFLRRESPGEVLVIPLLASRAIRKLGRCENAIEKSLAVLFDGMLDPSRLDDIDTMSNDGHVLRICRFTQNEKDCNVGGRPSDVDQFESSALLADSCVVAGTSSSSRWMICVIGLPLIPSGSLRPSR